MNVFLVTEAKDSILNVVVFLLAVSGAAPVLADSAPVPLCYPTPCKAQAK
jgi:hypothetical protein